MGQVIVIAGPTCAGKSETAIALARMVGGEIVSADSMQVYRGMDIGTAKLSIEDRRGIPHHMIDVADPDEDYNVSRYTEAALSAIDDISFRGKVPIITGGSGFYIDALLYEQPGTEPGTDPELRESLKKRVSMGELAELYRELECLDPEYASSVHPNNRVRIIRALEYIKTTGSPYSEYTGARADARPRFDHRFFILDDDRDELYARIDARVDAMIAGGILGEVRTLIKKGIGRDTVSMQGVGYRQMFDYISGDITLDDAVDSMKKETRHIAKRQLTWLRRIPDAEWIGVGNYVRDPESIARYILGRLS